LDVFIANGDGSEPKPLASHPDLDYSATFSPDGQWIVFTSHRDGGADRIVSTFFGAIVLLWLYRRLS